RSLANSARQGGICCGAGCTCICARAMPPASGRRHTATARLRRRLIGTTTERQPRARKSRVNGILISSLSSRRIRREGGNPPRGRRGNRLNGARNGRFRMARYDFRTPRLYLDAPLQSGAEVALDRDQSNYLFNVLRLPEGASVLLFNGRDGEWRSSVSKAGKRGGALHIAGQARAQTAATDLHLLFAPLKHARLDYLVQKAVEMGVSRIQPVITQHTQVT